MLDIGRVWPAAEKAAAETYRVPDGCENIERDLLRHEADQGAGPTVILHDVVPVHQDLP